MNVTFLDECKIHVCMYFFYLNVYATYTVSIVFVPSVCSLVYHLGI